MHQEVSWWGKVTCCLPVYAFMIYAHECNSTVASHTYTVLQSISLFSVLESPTPIALVSHGTSSTHTSVDAPTLLYCTYVLFLLRGCEKMCEKTYMFTQFPRNPFLLRGTNKVCCIKHMGINIFVVLRVDIICYITTPYKNSLNLLIITYDNFWVMIINPVSAIVTEVQYNILLSNATDR